MERIDKIVQDFICKELESDEESSDEALKPKAKKKKKEAKVRQAPINIGSVPFGLPTVALTRRTLDTQIRAKQLEMINDKLMRILQRPQEYVEMPK